MLADTSDRADSRPVQAEALAYITRRLSVAGDAPWLHGEVARRMAERLSLVRAQPRTVVNWWGDNGASSEALLQAYPRARHQPVEATDTSLPRVRPAPWWSARRWVGRNQAPCTPDRIEPQSAELVWANMMLHWVAQPLIEMRRWHGSLASGGFLMFSTLGPGTLSGLRQLYAQLGWGPPHAPYVDMHDLGDMLIRAGFAEPVMDQETITLTWPDATTLLDELRGMGGNADPERNTGLRTPRWRERLAHELGQLRAADGRLRLDFEVIYGHAFKVAPRPHRAAETQVPLDEMRSLVRAGRRTPGKPIGLR